MYFGSACLFNKKPEDMRRIGALGGRARTRNLRLRKACPVPVARELSRSHEETAAEAKARDTRLNRIVAIKVARAVLRAFRAGGAHGSRHFDSCRPCMVSWLDRGELSRIVAA